MVRRWNRSCRRAHLSLDDSHALHDRRGVRALAQEPPELGVAENERDLGENPEMGRYVGAHHAEERVDRPAVDRPEFHGPPQQAQGDERLGHVQQNGVPHVRNGDAIADAGRSHRLAGLEHAGQESSIHLGGQREPCHQLLQHSGFVLAGDIMMNAAGGEERRESWDRLRGLAGLVQEAAGNGDALLGSPLPQLEGVQAKTFVHPVRRQAALRDPLPDGRLVYVEVRGRLPDT